MQTPDPSSHFARCEQALREGRFADGQRPPVSMHFTACSLVGVFDDCALKLKRPVDLGYLDYSSRALRIEAAQRECAINARFSPGLYRGLSWLTANAAGELEIDGPGELIEPLVRMSPFDQAALFARLLAEGALTARDIDQAARLIARQEIAAPIIGPPGAARLAGVLASNASRLRSFSGRELDGDLVEQTIAASQAALERLQGLLDARAKAGQVRHCHGDLHLNNIVRIAEQVHTFDCIEFSDAFATMDVAYDVAFFFMDLWANGRADLAAQALGVWLDEAARDGAPGDGAGNGALDPFGALPAIGLFAATRAVVRAHVEAQHHRDLGTQPTESAPRARHYLELSASMLAPRQARLLAVSGLSGAGKSTLARQLAAHLVPAPGMLILRSDEVRKRLFGVSANDQLPKSHYTAQTASQTYQALLAQARLGLQAGWPVIVDAVCARAHERQALADLARDIGCAFDGLWLDVDVQTRCARVDARFGDASDADGQIARQQHADPIEQMGWISLRADRPIGDLLADSLLKLNRSA